MYLLFPVTVREHFPAGAKAVAKEQPSVLRHTLWWSISKNVMVSMAIAASRSIGATVGSSRSAWAPSVSRIRCRCFTAQTPKEMPKDESSTKKTQISWMRGYLGAHSNTDPPDATFIAVATIVTGAGYYAWFIDPPTPNQ